MEARGMMGERYVSSLPDVSLVRDKSRVARCVRGVTGS